MCSWSKPWWNNDLTMAFKDMRAARDMVKSYYQHFNCQSVIMVAEAKCCRWGETQSHAQSTPTNPNSPNTEPRRSRIKTQGRPLVSGSAGNSYSSIFSNQTTSQSKSP